MQSKIYICYYKDLRFPGYCFTKYCADNRCEAIRIGRAFVSQLNLDSHRKYCYFDSVYLFKQRDGKDSD